MRRNPAVKRNDRKSNLLDHSWRNDRLIFTQDHQGTGLWHVGGHFCGELGRGRWRLDRQKLFNVDSYSAGGSHGDGLALYPSSETYQSEG